MEEQETPRLASVEVEKETVLYTKPVELDSTFYADVSRWIF